MYASFPMIKDSQHWYMIDRPALSNSLHEQVSDIMTHFHEWICCKLGSEQTCRSSHYPGCSFSKTIDSCYRYPVNLGGSYWRVVSSILRCVGLCDQVMSCWDLISQWYLRYATEQASGRHLYFFSFKCDILVLFVVKSHLQAFTGVCVLDS